jgi:hypothetical protein
MQVYLRILISVYAILRVAPSENPFFQSGSYYLGEMTGKSQLRPHAAGSIIFLSMENHKARNFNFGQVFCRYFHQIFFSPGFRVNFQILALVLLQLFRFILTPFGISADFRDPEIQNIPNQILLYSENYIIIFQSEYYYIPNYS